MAYTPDMYDFTRPYDLATGGTLGAGVTTPGLLGSDPAGTLAAINTPKPASSIGGGTNLGDDPTSSGFGWNLGTLNLALGGLKTIGGLWAAWEENKLQKQQLKAQKEATNINLANQIMAYNTALEDKTRHRASYMEEAPATTQQYLASHKLANRQIS